jgi:hypothetical protein
MQLPDHFEGKRSRADLAGPVHRYNAAGLAGSHSQIARSRIKTHGAAAGRNWLNLSRPAPTPAVRALAARSARRIAAALRCRATRAFGWECSWRQAVTPPASSMAPAWCPCHPSSRTQPDRKRLEYLRGNKLAVTVFGDDIVDKTRDAWNFLSKIQCASRQSNPNMDNGQ